MDTIDIPLTERHDPAVLIALIERAASEAGLIADRRALRSYPGSIHWHLKRPGVRGTLELTYWPRQGRVWFSVHANRRADWIAPAIERLTAHIQ